MVVNVDFFTKSIHSPLISWSDRCLKKLKYQIQNIQNRRSSEKHITYMKHIKIHSCHMGIIFMPNQMIWHKLQCVHILSLIMQFHTGNVYCGAVLTVHVSILLTNKQIIIIQTQHPQYCFTFITSLHVVMLTVEFH